MNKVDWHNIDATLTDKLRKHYFESTESIEESFEFITDAYDRGEDWQNMIEYTYSKLRRFESQGVPMMSYRATFDDCLIRFRQYIKPVDLNKITTIITLKEAQTIMKQRDPRNNTFRINYPALLERLNYTGTKRTELAEALNVDVVTPLRSLEQNYKGNTKSVNLTILCKLCAYLKCDIMDIVERQYKG